MYNLKIIKCGDRLDIYKVNNYVISESKKSDEYKIIDKLLKEPKKEQKKH